MIVIERHMATNKRVCDLLLREIHDSYVKHGLTLTKETECCLHDLVEDIRPFVKPYELIGYQDQQPYQPRYVMNYDFGNNWDTIIVPVLNHPTMIKAIHRGQVEMDQSNETEPPAFAPSNDYINTFLIDLEAHYWVNHPESDPKFCFDHTDDDTWAEIDRLRQEIYDPVENWETQIWPMFHVECVMNGTVPFVMPWQSSLNRLKNGSSIVENIIQQSSITTTPNVLIF